MFLKSSIRFYFFPPTSFTSGALISSADGDDEIFSSFADTSTFFFTLGLLSGLRKFWVCASSACRCCSFMSDMDWFGFWLGWLMGVDVGTAVGVVWGRGGLGWRDICWMPGRWIGLGKDTLGTFGLITLPRIICGLRAPVNHKCFIFVIRDLFAILLKMPPCLLKDIFFNTRAQLTTVMVKNTDVYYHLHMISKVWEWETVSNFRYFL